MIRNPLYKAILVVTGLVSLVLGVMGVFLPVLPTTPFLLLSAFCFSRSSDRLHNWLLAHPWFGPYIRNFREHRAIPLKTKVWVLILLWVTMAISILFVINHWLLDLLLLCIAAGVSVYLIRLRTLQP